VGYTLLSLAPIGCQEEWLPQVDYAGYIRQLESDLIESLKSFDISGFRVEGKTGVWADPQTGEGLEKIASIGVKVDSRGISRHGFALNVDPDIYVLLGGDCALRLGGCEDGEYEGFS
jgi:lipoate-protein ligase B